MAVCCAHVYNTLTGSASVPVAGGFCVVAGSISYEVGGQCRRKEYWSGNQRGMKAIRGYMKAMDIGGVFNLPGLRTE